MNTESIFKLFEESLKLLQRSVASLIEEEVVDEEAWRNLLAAFLSAGSPMPPPVERIVDIGRIASADDPQEIRRITGGEEGEDDRANPAEAFLRAFAAVRLSRMEPERPEPLHELASRVYGLLPFYGRDSQRVQAVLRRVLNVTGQAFARGDVRGTVLQGAGTQATAVANSLAGKFGDSSFLDLALACGEKALADADARKDHGAAAALESNLIGTLRHLARRDPDRAEAFLTRAIQFARRIGERVAGADSWGQHEELRSHLRWISLRALVFLHAGLAGPTGTGAQHAESASQYAQDLEDLARKSADPDLQLEAAQVRRTLNEHLRGLREPQTVPEEEGLGESFDLGLDKGFEAGLEILKLAPFESQLERLEQEISTAFGKIERLLLGIVEEVGLNHRVCRILLVLGAVAGGRFGHIGFGPLLGWTMETVDPGTLPPGNRRDTLQRQQVLSADRPDAADIFTVLGSLLSLREALGGKRELADPLKLHLHRQLRELLRKLLAHRGMTEVLGDRTQGRDSDWNRLSAALPAPLIPALQGAADGSTEDRDLTVRRPRVSPLSERRPAEDEEEQRPAEIPKVEALIDPEVEARLPENWLRDNPEALVGAKYTLDGEEYRVDSLLGQGQEKVVFGLKSVETGRQLAVALFRSQGDPLTMLKHQMGELLQNEPYDAEAVIDICERILELDPEAEPAAFNKGIALMSKEDLASALECFDRALQLNPDDAYNWFYNALTLARLQRHAEAVDHLARALRIDRDRVWQLLGHAANRDPLIQSLGVARNAGHGSAGELLEGLSPSRS